MGFKPTRTHNDEYEGVESDVKSYIDGDMLAFVVASACETKKVVATYKPTGSVKEFKNKSEFWGRGKTIGGWLGETNEARIEKGKEPFKKEQFEVVETYSSSPVENCLYSVKNKLLTFQKHLKTGKPRIVMGTGDNFRHELELPTRYKANREEMRRPELLDETRRFMIESLGAEVVTGIEADDRLAMYQYKGYQGFLNKGFYTTVVGAIDKDARQTYGMLMNPTTEIVKKNGKQVSVFKYPEPLIVDGLGSLYEKGTKVKDYLGHGDAWLFYQILNGDDTDGYYPTKPFKKNFGSKSAYDALVNCTTRREYLQKLVDVYHDLFPTGVQYVSWTGKEMDLKPVEWMQMMFQCAYMKRWVNDDTDIITWLNEEQITYD